MTPGQARIALLSFQLVSAGVETNALFLQARAPAAGKGAGERASTRPAPDKAGKLGETPMTRRSGLPEEPALRIARFAPDHGKIDPAPAGPDESADAETIRAIQRELKLRGYGPVPGDGVIGLTTRAAIMAFEHDQAMALSGEASERLLKRILLGAADPGSAGSSRPRSDGRNAVATDTTSSSAVSSTKTACGPHASTSGPATRKPRGPAA